MKKTYLALFITCLVASGLDALITYKVLVVEKIPYLCEGNPNVARVLAMSSPLREAALALMIVGASAGVNIIGYVLYLTARRLNLDVQLSKKIPTIIGTLPPLLYSTAEAYTVIHNIMLYLAYAG